MAVLTPFATSHRFLQDTGVTASSGLTSTLRTELVTNLSWTEPVADRFKSPPDADGRFFEIIVSEPTSVRWQWQILDDLANTICTREILLTGAGENVRFFTGSHHVWVEIDKGAGIHEPLGAGLIDLSPASQIAHSNYTWGRGFRNSSGTNDGANDYIHEFFMLDNGSPGADGRLLGMRNEAGTAVVPLTFDGTAFVQPAWMTAQDSVPQRVVVGRMYQFVAASIGGTPTLPIGDAGETATFRLSEHRNLSTQRLMIRAD